MNVKTSLTISLAVALAIAIIGGGYLIEKYRIRAKKAESNLSVNTETWRDKENRFVVEVDQLTTNLKNMKNVFKQDSSRLSTDYEKHIFYLKKELEATGVKYRNLLNFTTGQVFVRDSFIIKLVKLDTTLAGLYFDGYLKQNFSIDTKNNLRSNYVYADTINVMSIRKPKLKDNGKKHWPNWGNLWWVGWDCKMLIYSNNPKASYTGVFSIRVDK